MHNFASLSCRLPAEAVQLSVPQIMQLLDQQFEADLYAAFDPTFSVPSPVASQRDTTWMKTANTVGINVRTIQHFWNVIPYVLTLPAAQNTIHLLPIWEPGVVASLYGPVSWNINPEFFSFALVKHFPQLDTVEKQLKVVINLLHLLGKAVGMDVVPHTDRYSEMAIANPQYFEWLQRRELGIIRHDSAVYTAVQIKIWQALQTMGSAIAPESLPNTAQEFYTALTEPQRLEHLFGWPADYGGRLARRKLFIQQLYTAGYETVPATMGPPYRGLEVDPNPEAQVTDEAGRVWRDYRITRPEAFSRAFGPLARYKLYESLDDNIHWVLDFDRPNHGAWEYVCAHYKQIQAHYNFDFMRGDMSHVQMRPDGVPAHPDARYDLLGAVKSAILPEKPYFAYFAESFLAPPGIMAYGDECDHLEASLADSTLGDLQSEPIGTEQFMRNFWQYRHWLETRRFAPNFTMMTADKDDPRFDAFYLTGNEIRYFLALFLTDMPSYMGLGFECRDPHPTPVANEDYTKLYVFSVPDGPKGTNGPYRWGRNSALYANLARQKQLAERIWPDIREARVKWLLPPDETGQQKVLAWTQLEAPRYVFVANLGMEQVDVEMLLPAGTWKHIFSTDTEEVDNYALEVGLNLTTRLRLTAMAGKGKIFQKIKF